MLYNMQPHNPYAQLFAQEVPSCSLPSLPTIAPIQCCIQVPVIPVIVSPAPLPVYDFTHNTNAPRNILIQVIRAWLEQHDNFFFNFHSIQSINERINSFIDIITTVLFNFNIPNYMVFPVVMYANKYVQRQGIKHDQLFHLLLASTMTTIKFWDDTASGVNKIIAGSFNYSLQSVNQVERNFLKGIDWDLTLHWEEVELFAVQILEYLNNSAVTCSSPQQTTLSSLSTLPTTPTSTNYSSSPSIVYIHDQYFNNYLLPGVYCYVTN